MPQGPHVRNPQTVQLLDMIGLRYNLDHGEVQDRHQGGFYSQQQGLLSGGPFPPPPPRIVTEAEVKDALSNPEEIDLNEDQEEEEEFSLDQSPPFRPRVGSPLA